MNTLLKIFVEIFTRTTITTDHIPQILIDRAVNNCLSLFLPIIIIIGVAVVIMKICEYSFGYWRDKTKICYLASVFIIAFAI